MFWLIQFWIFEGLHPWFINGLFVKAEKCSGKRALLKVSTPAATHSIQLSVCDENQPKLQWNMLSRWNPLKAVATRVATAKPKTMWTMLLYTFFSKPQADVCGSIIIKWNRSFDLLCNHSVILKKEGLICVYQWMSICILSSCTSHVSDSGRDRHNIFLSVVQWDCL